MDVDQKNLSANIREGTLAFAAIDTHWLDVDPVNIAFICNILIIVLLPGLVFFAIFKLIKKLKTIKGELKTIKGELNTIKGDK